MLCASGIHIVVQELQDRDTFLSFAAGQNKVSLKIRNGIRLQEFNDRSLFTRTEMIAVHWQNSACTFHHVAGMLADLPPEQDPSVCGISRSLPDFRSGSQDRVKEHCQVFLKGHLKSGYIFRLQIWKRLDRQFLSGKSQALSLLHDPRKRCERRFIFGHKFQNLGPQQRVVTLSLLSRCHIRQPSALHLRPEELLKTIGGKIVDYLMQTKFRLAHPHHLKREVRIHRRRRYIGQKAAEMLREPGQRRAACERGKVLRLQCKAEVYKFLVNRHSLREHLVSQLRVVFRSRSIGSQPEFG